MRFWSRWGALEEIYSAAVVREQSIGSNESQEILQDLEAIEQFVAELLG